MENMWINKTDYRGVKLTPKEAGLIVKILGNLSFNQRKEYLSEEEEELYCKLYVEITA